jgi:oligoendopeptidase F
MKDTKTAWDLGLLYKNDTDPQIEKDLKIIENACAHFEKKYKKSDFISTPQKLSRALEDMEELEKKINGSKPWWYFALKNRLNSSDEFAVAQSTKFNQRIIKSVNKITFFDLQIAKISKKDQGIFLKNQLLKPYAYALRRIFNNAEHKLSDDEEQIINLLSQTSYGMWVDGQEKLLEQQMVEFDGEKIALTKALSMFSGLETKKRRDLWQKIILAFKNISSFAEAEINAVYNYKKVIDEKKRYKKSYSKTILGNENDEKTIELLVSTVAKYFSISKRFYKIHAKLLNEKKISYADRNAGIGDIQKKFDFNESLQIVRDSFAKIDQKYVDIFDSFVKNRQIDVYPSKGKSGGAFCWGNGSLPTFVLLNHSDDINSVETFAHEMGHAIHTELSKTQPPRYRDYSMSVAEVASTFFEQVVTSELENYLSEDEKLVLLHNKIKGDVQTIFRQVACFNFEADLHSNIRDKGQVPKEDIAKLLSKHMKSYMGDSVDVTDDDGYGFVGWSHIRRFFYVYTYAYGQLISRALFENWKKDPSYEKKIYQFLSSGSSMSPEDIFKKIGIDVKDKTFFESGLKSIESDIVRLEKMVLKYKHSH